MNIIKFLKSLFCRHEFTFWRNVYGDEIIMLGWKRSVWRCEKCGRFQYRDELHKGGAA
jgi:hypothetical protein